MRSSLWEQGKLLQPRKKCEGPPESTVHPEGHLQPPSDAEQFKLIHVLDSPGHAVALFGCGRLIPTRSPWLPQAESPPASELLPNTRGCHIGTAAIFRPKRHHQAHTPVFLQTPTKPVPMRVPPQKAQP